MKRKKTPIPDFSSYEEAARFFDETDTTTLEFDSEGWECFYRAKDPGRGAKARLVRVPLELPAGDLRRARALARAKGRNPREWLTQLVHDALASASTK